MAALVPDPGVVETHIVEMTNAYRAKKDLGQLSRNPKLQAAARTYAAFLAKARDFSHTADGQTAGERIKRAGYAWCAVAENLALNLDSRGFESRSLAKQTVEGWINSPGHRKNLVAPNMTETGVAVVRAPDKHPKYITVQLFGRPKSKEIEFQISNSTKQPVRYVYGQEKLDLRPSTGVMHTSCVGDAVTFENVKFQEKPDGIMQNTSGAARLTPENGMVYTIKNGKNGGFSLVRSQRETID